MSWGEGGRSAGRILSPLLVGRDDLLDLVDRRLREVEGGRGHLLLLSGEAGIGKTRLGAAIRRMAEERGFTVASGAVVEEDRNVPAASFLDLARNLRRTAVLGTLGRDVLAAVRDVPGEGGPARRQVVHDLVELFTTAASGPTGLFFEDLHWADDLSLELLAEVARATTEAPVLLVGSYRNDELRPSSELRRWRSRLISQRTAEEVRLRRLTLEETGLVTSLIRDIGLPTPRDVATAVFRRTDGVPLFIEELLAALGPGAADRRAVAEADVPESVQDAIEQRIGRLSPDTRLVAAAGAVIGRRFDLDVLARMLDRTADELDDAIEELVQAGFLDRLSSGSLYDFHHQVLRDALYSSTAARERRRLHARAAELGAASDAMGDTHTSAHFERAGMRAEAFAAALVAARNAARLGSHREAEDLYRRAVRNMSAGLEPAVAAVVHESHGRELAAIDENEEASAALVEARRLYQLAGEPLAAAQVLLPLVQVRHVLGDGVALNEPLLREAIASLDGIAESDEWTRTRGRLFAALAFALSLALRIEEAEAAATEAIQLATAVDDELARISALATLAGFLPFRARTAEGAAFATEAFDRARAGGFDDELARALRILGASTSEVLDYPVAERRLLEGIEFSEQRELGNHANYMRAHLGLVLWATGRWDEAASISDQARADGRGGVTTQITARYVQGFVLLGRGRLAEAEAVLTDCLGLAEGMGEIIRLSFPLWGLAEVALLAGDPQRALDLTERAWIGSTAVRDVALFLPSIVTGVRARLAVGGADLADAWCREIEQAAESIPLPAVHAAIGHARGLILLRRGRLKPAAEALRAAQASWSGFHRSWEALWAGIDLGACLQRSSRWADAAILLFEMRQMASALGCPPALEAIDRLAGSGQGATVPDPWHPLSGREFEVAQKIAEGLTNAEIGERLFVAPKTVSAHVEHILAKLGVSRRAEIAAWAGTVRVPPSGPLGDRAIALTERGGR